ncbi:T9SS type A sorting domain-containing protein [Neolewinella lacunae]|uniref:T9SS type A sorting domain-containing protein n=1 Tax=Neolewinella lacunae TaxID=1517758 RepID=A0A923PNS8_9BACT|nr:T9SS type A sorting domain-containing protein [Neolewinella lacunae]MBC6995071.1 T9SS type A sorting domain-containing protein [Neolewinella lacunae]MDN3635380.1 T9SS type A sorting domain-containing protein [Neolewinella lacunae]
MKLISTKRLSPLAAILYSLLLIPFSAGANPITNVTAVPISAACGLSDGSITFLVSDFGSRTNIYYSIDGGENRQFAPTNAPYTFSGLLPGVYPIFAQWGNGDCPTQLGEVTVGENCGGGGGDAVTTFDYPGDRTDDPHEIFSDKFRVWVRQDNGAEEELEVLMTKANTRSLTGMPPALEADMLTRTFSYTHLNFRSDQRSELTFRVERLFGGAIAGASLHPRSYELAHSVNNDASEITFSLQANRKHISVVFNGPGNTTTNEGWVRHMLLISVDPVENNPPAINAPGTVVYAPDLNPALLESAQTIYFPPGYYNLYDFVAKNNGVEEEGFITYNGGIRLRSNQTVYIAGGAYVEGYIFNNGFNDARQRVIGRGIIDGRQYTWHAADDFDRDGANSRFRAIWQPPNGGTLKLQEFRPANPIQLGLNCVVDGIMAFTPPHHGIVSRENALMTNLKLVGWHFNNDGYRPNPGSIVDNIFSRAVDDHFYARGIRVTNSVLWPGPNGSIMTTGWNSLRLGSARMENIDVIHPEWRGGPNDRRTNEGLLMAQNNFNFAPIAQGGSTDQTNYFNNIRFEGSIPRLISLHLGQDPTYNLQTGDPIEGYLGDAVFENITVENQQFPSLMLGRENAVGPAGNYTFEVKNITYRNVEINGQCVTPSNKSNFFIEEFTRDIDYQGCAEDNNCTVRGVRVDTEPTTCGSKNGILVLSVPGFNSRTPLEYSIDGGQTFTAGRGHADAYVLTGLDPGDYQVLVRQASGDCTTNLGTFTVECTNSATTPLRNVLSLKVYPNPVTHVLRAEARLGANFVVINSLGQEVSKGVWSGELNVQALAKGTYVLRIGQQTARFVRQ